MARLIANVPVVEPARPGGPGEPALIPGEDYGWWGPAYGNAEDVPEHVARLIPNPKAWADGDVPFPADEPARQPATLRRPAPTRTGRPPAGQQDGDDPADPDPAGGRSPGIGDADDEAPPASGPGSTTAAWRAFAKARGVEVPEGASRDDIVELVRADQAGKGA